MRISPGSGKTTTLDILLGLLEPIIEMVMVDGLPKTRANHAAWRQNLRYVPQSILLSDATIWNNIALGVPTSRIDRDAAERAARTANLPDFIVGDLPKGYDAVIEERGVLLSGATYWFARAVS